MPPGISAPGPAQKLRARVHRGPGTGKAASARPVRAWAPRSDPRQARCSGSVYAPSALLRKREHEEAMRTLTRVRARSLSTAPWQGWVLWTPCGSHVLHNPPPSPGLGPPVPASFLAEGLRGQGSRLGRPERLRGVAGCPAICLSIRHRPASLDGHAWTEGWIHRA